MAQCQECGVDIAEIDVFCPFCGARQSAPSEPVDPAVEEKPSGQPALSMEELGEGPATGIDQEEKPELGLEPHADMAAEGELTAPPEAVDTLDEGFNGVDPDLTLVNEDLSGNVLTAPEAPEMAVEENVSENAVVDERLDRQATGEDFATVVEKGGGSESGGISSPSGEVSKTRHVSGTGTDGKKPGLKILPSETVLYGRYEITKKIGGGGMGAVYLAKDHNLGGVERAVKEMVQSSIEEEQQAKAIEDFRRESMILSTLDHPAIPTIYDYFYDESEGRFYLVMKFISGGDLAARLRSAPGGRIDERTVTEWAVQVADVLSYLHNLPQTIVYRDLKPSNIMLDGKTGKVMLIDFGIARAINSQEKGVTAVGTMGYAPPELFSGQVEPRSDIYSLGSTMFHLLTGTDPQNNPLLIFDFQKNPRPRQINSQLSDQMERILMKAVEYSAGSRFASAEEMRNVLSDHLANLKAGNITYGVTEIPDSLSLANQNVFCGFCGQRIVATDLFCAFCGAKQPMAQHGVHAEIYSRGGSATAKLVVDGTSELDTPVFTLDKPENLVGRRDPQSNIFPEVDLSKYDPQTKISRRHARIWREGGNFMVEDLGSSNGTVLIGMTDMVRLQPRQPHPLGNGDRLRLGDTTLHFLMG